MKPVRPIIISASTKVTIKGFYGTETVLYKVTDFYTIVLPLRSPNRKIVTNPFADTIILMEEFNETMQI